MTKCIVLGNNIPIIEDDKKRIIIKGGIDSDYSVNETEESGIMGNKASDYQCIELISKDYFQDGNDIMFGYSESRDNGIILFGHWNDGIV